MTALRDDLRQYTSKLTLLCVDDDSCYLEQVWLICVEWFARVITAKDGMQGLELALKAKPDLIITDHYMPVMTGLQMARELRDLDIRTPLILMTAGIDNSLLTDAIDLGVSKFIPKPVATASLASAFHEVAREIVSEQLREQTRRQELELLRFREQYHYKQQELASRKEEYLLRNELKRRRFLCGDDPGNAGWFLEIRYRPQQVMCGDGFMVRQLSNGDVLVFLVDAMGSGLSASLTSMCSTAYLNHLVDLHDEENRFDFERTVRLFLKFSRTILLPEEVLSCGFLHLDCSDSTLRAALFALPPLLVRNSEGSVVKVKGNNPPVSRYMGEHRTQNLELSGIESLLIATDGLTDAQTGDGSSYRDHLPADFGRSFFARDLEALYLERISECFDDVTFITLNRIDARLERSERFEAAPRLEEVSDAIRRVESYCAALENAGGDFVQEAVLAANEAIMNGFEHGCLGLSASEKAELLAGGGYESFMARADGSGRIRIDLATRRVGDGVLLLLTVTDSGPGFDLSRLSDKRAGAKELSGRGLRLIRKYTDGMFYNRKGNSVCLIKKVR